MANTTYTKDIYGVQQQIADEQAAQEQSYINEAVGLAGTKRAGMMLNARDIGRRQGNMYAGLGRMLTGEEEPVDPRMARMQKLESIMAKIPEPDTYDEYIQLAGLMNQAGLYGEAQEAMKMANEIRSSTPSPLTTKQQALEQFKLRPEYLNGTKNLMDFEREFAAAGRKPDNGTQTLDDEVYEANLQPYMATAMAALEIDNPKGLSGVELTKEARKMAQREYSKVTYAADLADNRTNFMKEYDFFVAQVDENGVRVNTNAQAIAKATSLDRETVDETNQKLQDEAVLEAQKTMSTELTTARDELRTSTQMLSILDKIDTNKWSAVIQSAATWLGVQNEDVANKELFFSMSIKKVMDYTSMTKGAISDAEMDLFKAAAPNLGKTTAGNRLLLRFAEEGARAQIRVAKHMREWKANQKLANGNRRPISFNEWEIEKTRFIDSAENSAQFADITNSEEWKSLAAVGDSINVSTDLKADLLNVNTDLGRFCADFPGSTVCQNLNRQFN
jgi:hypothetical protein